MMNVNSVYTGLANLAGRKTAAGLNLFNGLVEAGLVHFLNAKEEAEVKTVTVNLKELAEARQQSEKALAAARAVKSYRGVVVAKKAVKASRRIFAGLSRKVKGLAVMNLDSSNYVLATSSGKILAHFWLWQTTEGGYVIDSVESRSSMDVDILTSLVAEWVDVALDKANIFISDCGYGITQQVIKKLREEFTLAKEDEPRAAFDPVSHYSYRDSRNGVFFIE